MAATCRRLLAYREMGWFALPHAGGVLESRWVCYVHYPLWPSEPPRVIFPVHDLPPFDTVFRRFNLRMLGSYGIHTFFPALT